LITQVGASAADFPGDKTAPGRVDDLTAANVPATAACDVIRPANDMISFWIYIRVFIDDVRLFGRGKQIHSPA